MMQSFNQIYCPKCWEKHKNEPCWPTRSSRWEETTMNKEAYALIEENAATLKTRFDAVSYLLGYYGEIDAEIYEAIQAAYISDIIGE